jgi:hypothetical protein
MIEMEIFMKISRSNTAIKTAVRLYDGNPQSKKRRRRLSYAPGLTTATTAGAKRL